MSTQIAVRLADALVVELDRVVASGRAPSRASLVEAALERELRRLAAVSDAEILRRVGAGRRPRRPGRVDDRRHRRRGMSSREICLAKLDKTRPVVVLTRIPARPAMTKVTVAPIASTMKGLSSEVSVGRENGLDHVGAISLDNVVTVPAALLGRTLGFLSDAQERQLAVAMVLAFDLDVPLLAD